LVSNTAIEASAMAIPSRAKIRAFSESVLPCAALTWRAAELNACTGVVAA
jgi:hypothetical protein